MLKKHISDLIVRQLGFEPTECQIYTIEKLAEFITIEKPFPTFVLNGYAGTGKTSVISAMVKVLEELKIRAVLLAPTGRAAKVLSKYSEKSATTIHKKIYRQQTTTDGFSRFSLDRNLNKNTLFIVDEASMISNLPQEQNVFGSGYLLSDLIEYVFTGENCRLVLVGDTAQLPPVGVAISPALETEELRLFDLDLTACELTEVVRQTGDSGILHNATNIRKLVADEDPEGYWPIETEDFPDMIRLSGGELIDEITTCYDQFGPEETIVITRSNKRANRFNEGIRRTVLFRDEQISRGDLLMVVKNNYFWSKQLEELDFIANGDIAEIIRIGKYETRFGFQFANVTLRFLDYKNIELDCKIFLDTLTIEAPALTSDENRRLFDAVSEDYADIRNKRERWKKIREDEYFNALQVKFAYAITCHKAQGGQWKAVFLDHGYLTEEMIDREYLRWFYTAFTRASEKLYLVNFNKEFFGE